MNARFSSLLITSLAGLMLSGQAAAGPRHIDSSFPQFLANESQAERDYGKREEREMHKTNRQPGKKAERKAEGTQRERGYGYGYERRYSQPQHDERGRH